MVNLIINALGTGEIILLLIGVILTILFYLLIAVIIRYISRKK